MQYPYHARGRRSTLCARLPCGPRDAGGPQGRGRWEAQTVKKMTRPCGKDDREAGGPRREDHTATSHAMASVRAVPAARSANVSVARRGWGRGIGWRGACPGTCALRDAMTRTVGGVRRGRTLGPRSAHGPACTGPGGWRGTMVQGSVRHAGRTGAVLTLAGGGPHMLCLGICSPCRLPDGPCAVAVALTLPRASARAVPQDRLEPARHVCPRRTSGSSLVLACAARDGPGTGHGHGARHAQRRRAGACATSRAPGGSI